MEKVLFIGLGAMGLPMSLNLKKAGYEVYGYDSFPSGVERAKEQGLLMVSKEEWKNFSYVISMLPSGKETQEVYLKEGLMEKLPQGSLFLDCTTADPEDIEIVYKEAKEKKHIFFDCPVSGGVKGAQGGTLSFLVGGEEEHFPTIKPFLEAMGSKVFYTGKTGSGQVAKICNNMLLSVLMVGTSEALALGKKMGMDPKVLSEVMKNSSGSNWVLDVYNPYPGVMPEAPASNNYQPGFMVDLMLKDAGLAQKIAKKTNSLIPMGTKAYQVYQKHAEGKEGVGRMDFSSVIQEVLKED